jgi:hypothetical protein
MVPRRAIKKGNGKKDIKHRKRKEEKELAGMATRRKGILEGIKLRKRETEKERTRWARRCLWIREQIYHHFPFNGWPQNGQLWEEGMDVQFGEDATGNTNCGRWIGRNFGHHFCPSNELFTNSTPPSFLLPGDG